MTDSIIKKIIIPASELPSTGPTENSILIRFRIISEDKNRASHWSPTYVIQKNNP